VDVAPRRSGGRAGLFALAFASGFAVLTIEIAGARLIAPVFGLSAVPWTAVIGVILAALAVGSHLGGRFADSGAVPLSTVLTVAGFTGALPVLGGGFPWMARDVLGFIPGAVVSAVVLFAPPVLCLGAVVPYLVQADTESLGTVGRRAGDVSAAATAGSIAGTFATGFVLLPAFPLPLLLGLTAAGLFVMAAVSGRMLRSGPGERQLLVGALILGGLGWAASRPGPGTLAARQTLYASVQVTEREWADGRVVREMFQNGGSSSAEYVDTGEPAHGYVFTSQRLLEPVIDEVESMLVLGGAALTLPVAFEHRRPGLAITVVEIDPAVTRLAEEYFAYGEGSYPGIDVVHEDARVFLRSSDGCLRPPAHGPVDARHRRRAPRHGGQAHAGRPLRGQRALPARGSRRGLPGALPRHPRRGVRGGARLPVRPRPRRCRDAEPDRGRQPTTGQDSGGRVGGRSNRGSGGPHPHGRVGTRRVPAGQGLPERARMEPEAMTRCR
jgi:predicted membrane-bound spermidine synthase